jgi:CheY-like chemotaxis protein
MRMSNGTILLVDDSRVSRMAVRNAIVKLRPDAQFAEASNGDEAEVAVAAHKPILVMMDLNMPGRDGLEISTKLRSEDPALPIIIVTANTQDAVRTRAIDLGLGYLGKPIVGAELEAYLVKWQL